MSQPDYKALGVPEGAVEAIVAALDARYEELPPPDDREAAEISAAAAYPEIHRAVVVAEEHERLRKEFQRRMDALDLNEPRAREKRNWWKQARAALNNQADNQGEAG